ncbi:hypothetical protein RhiirC2_799227 [Rhizophagus irregularis]|uniref:Uncharacterized protein n=1 Tax=Rhizophagus irregularis TaxID=588596 RepID=A0A2N1M5A4_9GLOM|nr:hypothetical protein RhiirC2_799227 [Rhizophagus irregularis]
MPSAPSFEPANISPARQEIVSPAYYQSSNCRSDIGKLFISSQYVKQPKGTVLRLGDGTEITPKAQYITYSLFFALCNLHT